MHTPSSHVQIHTKVMIRSVTEICLVEVIVLKRFRTRNENLSNQLSLPVATAAKAVDKRKKQENKKYTSGRPSPPNTDHWLLMYA
jgi:hypothetical protein